MRRAVDGGLVGRQLDTHIVICGFPRTGTTLLQLLIESCVEDICSFVGEVEAGWACRNANRRHRWMVTKRPDDISEIDRLRDWYRDHPGRLAALLPIRDPRDVLTSTHAGYPPSRGYYCEPERWSAVHRRVRNLEGDADVTTLRYEDLVRCPQQVQDLLDERLGLERIARFEDYESFAETKAHTLHDIDLGALGGIRPIDDQAVDRWEQPEHRDRLVAMLRVLPELPEAVRHWGYASDDGWVERLVSR